MAYPKLKQPAPSFDGPVVLNDQITYMSLSHFKGKYVIVIFLPRDFIFPCPSGILEFSDRISEFRNNNCEVIGISCLNEENHLAFTKIFLQKHGVEHPKFPMLCDESGEIVEAYGMLCGDNVIPSGGLFVISPDQKLRQITINDPEIGYSVDDTLRYVQNLQHAEKLLKQLEDYFSDEIGGNAPNLE